MKRHITCAYGLLIAGLLTGQPCAEGKVTGTLRVHVAGANNQSAYVFVRAKFESGEVGDPWAVRFFDEQNQEVPYFVWDSITWEVAAKGRADWGNQYPLINHASGRDPEIPEARTRKIEWAKQHQPTLGDKLAAREEATAKHGSSVCAALYLLRYPVAPFAKQRFTLRTYDEPQFQPGKKSWTNREPLPPPPSVGQGELNVAGLPHRLSIAWRGKKLFDYAGFDAGQTANTESRIDADAPFTVEATPGFITKLTVHGSSAGRNSGSMSWHTDYWLFPEGAYVALEGFSLSNTTDYVGGSQKISIWETAGEFSEVHAPLWESPWWLHKAGEQGFVATHLFHSTPLAIGLGNNPFVANSMAPPTRAATMDLQGNRLGLRWFYSLDDLAVTRLFAPALYHQLGRYTTRPEDGKEWLDNNRQVVASGKVGKPPEWMTPAAQQFIEKQLKLVRWQPNIDWFYRQYAVGVGEKSDAAESSLRGVLGAAAGWIDRPFGEEELAGLLADTARSFSTAAGLKWSREMEAVPPLLNRDLPGLKQALARWPNQVELTERYIQLMETNLAAGGDPLQGRAGKDSQRGEGWIVNPSYHATQLPYNVRFLRHFELPHPEEDYRQAIMKFADYSLDLLGGKPLDYAKLRKSYVSHWPSRFVAVIPLMLAAHDIKPDERYARAAVEMFDIVMDMVERNPQGYWTPWVAEPKNWETFDTVYNGAGVVRGLPAFWADGKLSLVGRERASNFVTAQARYLVFSGQLSDTLETDNVTAIYASKHGGHPAPRKQIPLFLFDDFEFYRGLFGGLIEWSAATPSYPGGYGELVGGFADRELGLLDSGCYLFRWAMGMESNAQGGGKTSASKWFDSRTEKLRDTTGFRVRVWNRLPWAESTLSLNSRDLGLSILGPKGPVQANLLWLRCNEPAYREPLTVEIAAPAADRLEVDVNRSVYLRVYYSALCPKLNEQGPPQLFVRGENDTFAPVIAPEGEEIIRTDGLIEWQAKPGTYEIRGR